MQIRFAPPMSGITATIGSLFGNRKDDAEQAKRVIDVDRNGNTLYKEEIIHNILEEL